MPISDISVSFRKLSEYQDRVPGHRRNRRVHLSTLIRWCTRGGRLPDGSRLRLQAARVGTRWLTTDAWFAEFLDRLTAANLTDPVPTRTPAERTAASAQAEQQLVRLGM